VEGRKEEVNICGSVTCCDKILTIKIWW